MKTKSLLAHSPEFHVPNRTEDSKAESKKVEDNSVNEKSETEPKQQISSPTLENPAQENQGGTTTEEKVMNSVDLPKTNIFLPESGEIVFLLLLTTPFLLFSMKRYIFSQIK
ncbi:MAG: hypothetical protein WBA93_03495 [Microcoleaceae cyanobacterium]